jgi:hypothetical protein
MRRSGWLLALLGVAGIVFFWLTDPRYGFVKPAGNLIDAANEARLPTAVGIVGSVVVLTIGVWLGTRRPT